MKLSLGAALGVVLALALVMGFPPQAQEPDDEEESESNGVTETELDLYIEVYSAMQADHDLTIDAALAPRQTTLEKFRNIEQRVQREQRLVDRVRQALLESAKKHSVATALGTQSEATATPRAPEQKDSEEQEQD